MPATLRLASHTALNALPALVLDLETTGLDVTGDRVVQIGAVAMLGPRILDRPRIDSLIDPGRPVPPSSSRIHGIGDDDVRGAPTFASFAAELFEAMAGRAVVGHNIAFDLAVLRHEAARHGIEWHDPPALDVGLIVGGLEPSQPDLGLDALAHALGVQVEGRHTAHGDALATAAVFSALLPRLLEADVRTLGEAQSLGERRSDLVLRQAEAGWHAVPGAAAAARAAPPMMRVDSYIFSRRVDDVMSATPLTIDASATLREAAFAMVEHRVGALLVGEPARAPLGILTERDVLRATAEAVLDPDEARVEQAMSTPVETMAAGEVIYRALGRMDRLGVRHLCIVNPDGAAVGMVSQRDLLRHRARSAVVLGDALAEAEDATALAEAHGRLAEVAAALVAEQLGGVEIARIVSNEVRAMTARAATLTAARLQADGHGPAPAPWCMLVLGSGGRGESLLNADQDNALIHTGSDADDAWFARLGAGVADMLDHAGIPRCGGGVMAANAGWRGSQERWRERIADWLNRASPGDLLNVDIFFDLMPVAGEAIVARSLHAAAVEAAAGAPGFLAFLAESVAAKVPPLGLFSRLRTDDAGRVDLKLGGLLPLVSLSRTLALRVGSDARSTPGRLRAAHAAGRLAAGDAEALIAVHADLMTHVLRQQVADLEAGVRPSGRVHPGTLERTARRRLRQQLVRLRDTLDTLRGTMD